MKRYKFKIKENDLICVEINGESVDFKLAEMFNHNMDFEDIDFLNEIHETISISNDMINAAKLWLNNNPK